MTTAMQVVKFLLSLLLFCALRGPFVVLFMCVDLKESERNGVIHFEVKTLFFGRDLWMKGKQKRWLGLHLPVVGMSQPGVQSHAIYCSHAASSPLHLGTFYVCILIIFC